MSAVSATRARFPKNVRKAVNAGHASLAVGMVGVEWVLIAINVAARRADDPQTRRGAYRAMEAVTLGAGLPLAFLSLVSGLLLCRYTPWGLWRHLWTGAKLVLLVAVVAVGAAFMAPLIDDLIRESGPGGNGGRLPALQNWQLAGAVFQLAAVVVATFLSVFKPSGRRKGNRPAAGGHPGGSRVVPSTGPGGRGPAVTRP